MFKNWKSKEEEMENIEIYHFQPKPNMKLAIFEQMWSKEIDGVKYLSIEHFINNDKYIIHDVKIFKESKNGHTFRYVWYENK
ncbi:hypothetical protein HLK66_25930 (plasmid) [Niallia circulans]|uniref:hypothetical protein n=1 Tax=Niallia circulans TaxID=1397 RepID=UPI00148F6737|nr:hypothetical protein [Niallia circulans]QJX65124.1 hypothetical protein HLK66_25930 [Niallia circulans]